MTAHPRPARKAVKVYPRMPGGSPDRLPELLEVYRGKSVRRLTGMRRPWCASGIHPEALRHFFSDLSEEQMLAPTESSPELRRRLPAGAGSPGPAAQEPVRPPQKNQVNVVVHLVRPSNLALELLAAKDCRAALLAAGCDG